MHIGMLLHHQGIQLGPKTNSPPGTSLTVQDTNDTGTANTPGHFNTAIPQAFSDKISRMIFIKTGFRMLMNDMQPVLQFGTMFIKPLTHNTQTRLPLPALYSQNKNILSSNFCRLQGIIRHIFIFMRCIGMPANSRDIIFQHSALTHRLDVLATDAIRVTDPLFVEHTGCTIREYRVLRMIDEHGGITFKDILVITGLDRSLVSRLIRILLERQLIYRVNSEQDARRFGLFTSETGRQRCQKGRELSAAAENILLAALAPQEMVALNSMLEKLFVRVSSANYAEQLQALSVRA